MKEQLNLESIFNSSNSNNETLNYEYSKEYHAYYDGFIYITIESSKLIDDYSRRYILDFKCDRDTYKIVGDVYAHKPFGHGEGYCGKHILNNDCTLDLISDRYIKTRVCSAVINLDPNASDVDCWSVNDDSFESDFKDNYIDILFEVNDRIREDKINKYWR